MAGPPVPLSTHEGETNRRAITLVNPSQSVPSPGFELALAQRPSKASKRTHEQERRRQRPYLFETLRASLLTRIVADTLDWDGKLQLTFHPNIPGWGGESTLMTI